MSPELIETSPEDLAFAMVVTFFVGVVACILFQWAIQWAIYLFCHIRAWIKGRGIRKEIALLDKEIALIKKAKE